MPDLTSDAWRPRVNVRFEVRTLPALPALEGPHELAWSYILDAIFADAHLARLESLFLQLPSAELVSRVQLRAELTPGPEGAAGSGLAWLAGEGDQHQPIAGRIYRLRFGMLAPRALRRASADHGRAAEPSSILSVYTWRVLAWGIPINLANRAGRPDIADRASYAMRHDFARARATQAYYHLSTSVR